MTGFEPATSSSRTTRATKLRHTPKGLILLTLRDVGYFAKGGVTHLLLEVVAYAVDEAIMGTTDQIRITLHKNGALGVADNGRGTAVRNVSGMQMVKPIMTTQDLRFFGVDEAPLLPDGLARSGISVVAALSEWAIHTNRRSDGSWTQRYKRGLPAGSATAINANGTTGTSVTFLPNPALFGSEVVSVSDLRQLCFKFCKVADFVIMEES